MLNYLKPNSAEDAKAMFDEYTNSKLLVGGTDLTLELKREKLTAENIIDLDRISELKIIAEDTDSITLGSMGTFTEVLGSSIIKTTAPAVLNAIYDDVGVRIYDMPATCDKLLLAIKNKNNK